MRYSIPRKSRRVPLVTDVHLKLEEVPDPVTAVTSNVSLGGMSVAVERTAEVGSLVAFELEVGGALVEGTGEVAWVRGEPAAPGVETGMGIRFRYLSPGSRERIFRLVQWYSSQGGAVSPEEVSAAASGLTPPPGGVKTPAPPRPAPSEAAPPPAAVPREPVPSAASASAPVDPESTAPFLRRPQPAPAPTALEAATPALAEPDAAFDLPGPAAVAPQPTVLVDEDDDIPPLPATYGGTAAGPGWESAADVRSQSSGPTAGEPLVLPEAPKEPLVAPADVAQVPFSRLVQPPAVRGAGYARERKWGVWMWLAVLLLAGLAVFAAVRWWMVAQRLGYVPSSEDRQVSASSAATPGAAPRPLPNLAAGVPRREDAERLPSTPSVAPPAGEPSLAPIPSPVDDPGAVAAEPEPAEVAAPSDSSEPGTPASVEPAVPAAPAPAGPPGTEVLSIRWQESSGATTVVIQANGDVPRGNLLSSPLGGANPRVLIRIRGIGRQYTDTRLNVGTPELAAIRTGLHVTNLGPELHVVLDLGGRQVELTSLETGAGGTIRAVLSKSG